MLASAPRRLSSSDFANALIVVAAGAPPTQGGTSLVLHRVLSSPVMPALHVFVDRRMRRRVRMRKGAMLPGRYRWLWKAPTSRRLPIPAQWLFGCFNLLSAWLSGLRIARVCRRQGAAWVLSAADSGISQIAGAVAARRAGLPHVIWVLDLWEENTYPSFDRLVARRLERRLWRKAAAIVVHSEEAAEHYARKHGVSCEVLRTPIDEPGRMPIRAVSGSRREVLYAGSLYWAQEDAVRRLQRAAALLGPDVRLTLLTEEHMLTAEGIAAHHVEYGVPEAEFRDRLAQADVLVLGLSFNTPYPAIIRTAAPARFPEYLATGVPIVVHAPPDSHVARRAKELDLAQVADQPTDDSLRASLQAVLDNPSEATKRAVRSREAALEHDRVQVAAQFARLLLGISSREQVGRSGVTPSHQDIPSQAAPV